MLALEKGPEVIGLRDGDIPDLADGVEEAVLEPGVIKALREVFAIDGALHEEGFAGPFEGCPGDFATIGAQDVVGAGFDKALTGERRGLGGRGFAIAGAGGEAAGDLVLL